MISTDDSWEAAPHCVVVAKDEVHVWCASLKQGQERVRALYAHLDEGERAKATRFHFEKDRRHYTVARGVLRGLLGRYLRVPPARIIFSYNRYGKPALAGEFAAGGLRFNVSHSGGVGLFAFTLGRELGVDVESLREDFASREIAERFFSGREVSALCTVPPEQQTRAFFNCWTRKEAYIKALGEGLSHPLNSFAVSLAPGEPARLLSSNIDPREAQRWSMFELNAPHGFAAALAVEGAGLRVRCYEWDGPNLPATEHIRS
jgi:4'-phosphopantetheinyl transferase